MVTTKISIKAHLKEYLTGKFNDGEETPVHFPHEYDIYHLIFDLVEKRQAGVIDQGNLEIYLPEPRNGGKKTATYNYLSIRSQQILERKIEIMMWAELHDLLDYNRHQLGMQYNETVFLFMKKYNIVSLSEDAMIKNYYRHREKIRRRSERRKYSKKYG